MDNKSLPGKWSENWKCFLKRNKHKALERVVERTLHACPLGSGVNLFRGIPWWRARPRLEQDLRLEATERLGF